MSEMTAEQLQAIVEDARKQQASSWGDVARFFTSFLLNRPTTQATNTTPTHITQARNIVKQAFAPEGSSMTTAPATIANEDFATDSAAAQKQSFFIRMGQSIWKNKESIIVGGAVSYVARAALAAKFTAAAGSLFNPATAAVVGALALGATVGGVTGIIRDRLSNDEKIIAARAKKHWWMKSFAKGAGFGLLGGAFGTVGIDLVREAVTSEPVIAALTVVTDAWKDHALPAVTAVKAFVVEKAHDLGEFRAAALETVKSSVLKAQNFCAALPEKIIPAAQDAMSFVSSKVGGFFSRIGDMLTLSRPPMEVQGIIPTPMADTLTQTVAEPSTLPEIDSKKLHEVLTEITPQPEPEVPAEPLAPVLPQVPANFKDLFTPEAYTHLVSNEKMTPWLKLANSDNASKSLRALKEMTASLMNSSDPTVRASAGQVINVMYGRAVDTGMTETPIGNEIERLISYAYAKGGFGLEKSELAASAMAMLAEPNGDKFTKGLLATMEAKKPSLFEKAVKVAANTRQYILPRGPILQNG